MKGQYRRSDRLRGERIPADLLRALPKADLHCHLDGSLRLETLVELGRAAGLDLPSDLGRARAELLPGDRVLPLDEFLGYFERPLAVLQTPENLQRVAREVALDAAVRQTVLLVLAVAALVWRRWRKRGRPAARATTPRPSASRRMWRPSSRSISIDTSRRRKAGSCRFSGPRTRSRTRRRCSTSPPNARASRL